MSPHCTLYLKDTRVRVVLLDWRDFEAYHTTQHLTLSLAHRHTHSLSLSSPSMAGELAFGISV